jgi:hypothetical protein
MESGEGRRIQLGELKMPTNYTAEPEFWPSDLGELDENGDIARRAEVVKEWLENILTSDLKGKTNQLSMVIDTRERLKKYGLATRFTENQFYFLKGIYERVTGDESSEKF